MPIGVDLVVVPRGPGLTFERARASLPSLARAVARRLGGPAPPKSDAMTWALAIARGIERAVIALLVGLIRVYQWTISPLIGPACRFEPSCSRYMVGAVRK